MQATANYSWSDLFIADNPAAAVVTVPCRVLRKRGEPLLLLPTRPDLAAQALALYPAQSSLARFARAAIGVALRCRLPACDGSELAVAPDEPFPKFLRELAGTKNFPDVAVLAGNPRAAGRRFLILVYNASARPAVVVKAGVGSAAKDLIAREASFLESAPAAPGVPKVRARFQSARLDAFALDFIPGDAPRDVAPAAGLLAAWLDRTTTLEARALAVWQRLRDAAPADARFARLEKNLAGKTFHPALAHGDFAPWNVKAGADGRWTALDWERGERPGPPAWDWFHFVLQPAMLVEKISGAALAGRAEIFLRSPEFQEYAQAAGLAGCERDWLLAYLLYQRDVIRPAEGLAATRELLAALAAE